MGRLIKISLLVTAGLLMLAGLLLYLYVRSPAFDGWIRSRIISTLEDRFAVRVELGAVDFDLLGTRLELQGLRIHNRAYPAAEPALDMDRILLDFSITHFLLPKISLDALVLDAPRLRILEDRNNRINLSNMFFRPGGRPREGRFSLTRLAIRRLALREGLIVYRKRPIQVESLEGALDVEMRFLPGESKYNGTAHLKRFTLSVAAFQLSEVEAVMNFDYFEDRLHFSSLTLDSLEVDAQAKGTLESLRDLTYEFQAHLNVDLPALKRPDFSPYFQESLVECDGTFSGRGAEFTFEGQGRSPLIRFLGLAFRNLETSFLMTRRWADVPDLKVRFYGGLVQAGGRLAWAEGESSHFRINSSGVGIRPLLLALGQRHIQAQGAGSFQGNLRWPALNWRHMNGQGQTIYSGAFIPALQQEEIPFAGTSGVRFQSGGLRLVKGTARTPLTLINYEGLITFVGGYDLNLQLTSEHSSELPRLGQSLGILSAELFDTYPLDLQGATSASVKLKGWRGRFSLSGAVESQSIHLKNQLVGNFSSRIALDRTLLELKDSHLEGSDYELRGSLLLPLGEAEKDFTTLQVELHQLPIHRFLRLLPQPPEQPVQGRLSGSLRIREYAAGRYQGEGTLSILQPTAYGESLDRLEGEIEFQDKRISVSRLKAGLKGGILAGEISFDAGTRTGRAQLQGNQVPLESIQAIQRQVSARGRVDFSLRGAGTFEKPEIDAQLTSAEIYLREHAFREVKLDATSQGDRATFTLQTGFRGNRFRAEGQIELAEPYVLTSNLEFQQTPVAPYLGLLPLENLPDIGGQVTGKVRISGPLKETGSLRGEAHFPQVHLSMAGYGIRNSSPVELSYEGGMLTIRPLTFTGAETQLTLSGTIKTEQPRTLNLKIDGNANLLILNTFLGAGAASGQLQLQTVVVGPLEGPRIVGTADLRDGFLSHPDLPTTLVQAGGRFKFTANQVSIDRFSARTIFGLLTAEGGVFLEGFKPARWRVNLAGSGLRLEYPKNVVSVVDAELTSLKSRTSQIITGTMYVRGAEYTQPITLPELIVRQTSQDLTTSPTVRGQEIVLDIDVQAHRSLRVQNNLADIVASGNFTVRGTLDSPVILGRVNMEEGKLFLENNTYEITRGNIAFNNPRRTTPVFNLEAETTIREFALTVAVRGPIQNLNMSFRSEPPLPTQSIVSLLAVGQTQEEIFGVEGAQPQLGTLAVYGAGAYLSKSVGEKLETQTSRLFGFEKFSIDPFLFGRERNPEARVTLGKQITEKLAVTYSTFLGTERQSVVLEYAVTDWLTAVGTRDLDGSIAIDFKLKKRF